MTEPLTLNFTTSEERHGGQARGRPSHLSVGSLITNASGLAESTISQGTAWTGESADTSARISQFPAPPTQLPTPTSSIRSGSSSPRSVALSLRKSLSSSFTLSPHLSCPPPPLPTNPHALVSTEASHSSGVQFNADLARVSVTVQEQTAPLRLNKRTPYANSTPTGSPVSPYKGQSTLLPSPGHDGRTASSESECKRPPSPSTLAGSSMYDWNDGMSGVSINTGEERLLSTTFITSLLAQSPDPLAAVQPPTSWNNQRRGSKGGYKPDATPDDTLRGRDRRAVNQAEGSGPQRHAARQSLPQSVYSEVFAPPLPQARSPLSATSVADQPKPKDGASVVASSIRTSADYSETLHSDEQVQSLVRSPSVLAKGKAAKAIGITPAYRVSYAGGDTRGHPDSAGNSVLTAASTILAVPPLHRADVPTSVSGHFKLLDTDSIPRESEEDFGRKMGSLSIEMDNYQFGQSLDLPNSPALPSTAGTETRFADAQSDSRRQSRRQLSRNQSLRSAVSSLVSRISTTSSSRRAKYMAWLKKRPLPPLPPMARTLPIDPHNSEILKYEEEIPLPTLAKRAVALQEMLDGVEVPNAIHRRPNSQYYKELETDNLRQPSIPGQHNDIPVQNTAPSAKGTAAGGDRKSWFGGRSLPPAPSKSNLWPIPKSKRFRIIIVACLVFGIVLAVAVPVGVSKQHKSSASLPSCSGNSTGVECNLDATCVCTATSGSSCKPLAKSLVNLIPTVNSFFSANFSGPSLSDALFNAQGAPQGSNCARQAMLIDVAPGLTQDHFPNRTSWAQSVILWNLGLSQDLNATTVLQTFVAKQAPWSVLGSEDGQVPDASGTFSITASGLIFDFAAQSISPVPTSFRDDADPTSSQLSELSASNTQILDRMYAFAKASSSQRQRALLNYWTSTLQQQAGDLPEFIAAITSSPFLLPFDATISNLTSLMVPGPNGEFPPPLACYPSLPASQLSRVNSVEVSVFGLSPATSVNGFQSSCFQNRPVYGIVDVLRLRLPFTDGRQGVGKQASLLSTDAQKRAILYSGEALSALPGATSVPALTNASLDPREYGTSDHIDHVILNYLSSITDVALAMDLVQFVLSGSSTPPANSSGLALNASFIPVLEFAVFGSITPPDLLSSVSSFSSPSGSLFFGSEAGQTFRTWALNQSSASIAWAQSALSPEIVRESAAQDNNFESVWTPASQLVSAGLTNTSDVAKVTQSLLSLGLFTTS